jgi:ionotropic glutamate receptor
LLFLLKYGVAAVFGPESETTSRHAGNICDAKEVPFIETHYSYEPSGQVVNLYPSEGTLVQAALDLLQNFEWGSFTIMYETASWLPRLSELLKMNDVKGSTITVRQIDLGITNRNKKNFRAVLRRIKQSDDKRIIIECSVDSLSEVLTQV